MKVGNCPILSKYDGDLLPKIRSTVLSGDCTSLKNKMCLNYFKSEYNLKDKELLATIADKIEVISGKKFIVFKDSFINKIKRKNNIDNMIYTVDDKDFYDLLQENNILDYYQVNEKKYIVIY